MANRLFFIAVAAFWVTMNVLLWRSEFANRNQPGSSVPVEVVWQKILTSPDNSNLEIRQHNKRIGFCHWSANIGEEMATGKVYSEDYPPEGMVKKLNGYNLDLDGNVFVGDRTNRFRFYIGMRFNREKAWEDFDVRVTQRPLNWGLHASNPDEKLFLTVKDGESVWEREFKFAELRQPEKLLQEVAGPMLAPMLAASVGGSLNEIKSASNRLKWEARNDWIKINFTPVRVYRLRAQLVDRYEIVVIVSRVGEILRMDLPNGISLLNEEFR